MNAGADRQRAAFLNRKLKMPVIAGVTQDEGTALGAHVTVGDQMPNINMAIHGVLLPGGTPVILSALEACVLARVCLYVLTVYHALRCTCSGQNTIAIHFSHPCTARLPSVPCR